MENPVDVLLIVAHDGGLHGCISNKPKIEINRHQRPRIILSTVLCQRLAVDEIPYLSARGLGYECMPSGNASTARVKDIVFFPILFLTEGPPRSRIQRSPGNAPAAILH